MNKYTATGLLAAAATGKRVLVVSPHYRASQQAHAQVASQAEHIHTVRIVHLLGERRIELGSTDGVITFVTPTNVRGRSADEVLVDDEYAFAQDPRPVLLPVIATSPHGELVRG
ncbi:hypothetical protein [Marisediminicola senii]|uniref:hypothetical protein n=1 Tax=Marisediminicola senii TaxID=2711233 RepID=UPI0013E9F5B9|nr:hypothetical protein [Marisediminicola senii]